MDLSFFSNSTFGQFVRHILLKGVLQDHTVLQKRLRIVLEDVTFLDAYTKSGVARKSSLQKTCCILQQSAGWQLRGIWHCLLCTFFWLWLRQWRELCLLLQKAFSAIVLMHAAVSIRRPSSRRSTQCNRRNIVNLLSPVAPQAAF